MRTLADLANQFDVLSTTLPRQATSKLSVECTEVILTDLLFTTPVDSSKALSNWQVTLNAPSDAILPPYYVGMLGSTAVISREAALQAAKQVLQAKKPSDTIYISNALPYIRRLNEGWSAQAPAGFIERAILIGRLFTENPTSFAK